MDRAGRSQPTERLEETLYYVHRHGEISALQKSAGKTPTDCTETRTSSSFHFAKVYHMGNFLLIFFFLPKLIDDLSTPNCKFPDQNYSCLSSKSYRILARGNSLRETPVSGFTLLHETQPKIVPQFFFPPFCLKRIKILRTHGDSLLLTP